MKRGQAALEFLMTYGWAILVVLAAIAALAYFGVLNPDRFLPEKCTLPSGLACLDYKASNGTSMTLIIQNSLGVDISGIQIGINGTGCVPTNQTTGATSLINGVKGTYVFTCAGASSGKFNGVVSFTYTNQDTSLTHTKFGQLILTVP